MCKCNTVVGWLIVYNLNEAVKECLLFGSWMILKCHRVSIISWELNVSLVTVQSALLPGVLHRNDDLSRNKCQDYSDSAVNFRDILIRNCIFTIFRSEWVITGENFEIWQRSGMFSLPHSGGF